MRWIFAPQPSESLFAAPGLALGEAGRRFDLILKMRFRKVEPAGLIERRRGGARSRRTSSTGSPIRSAPCSIPSVREARSISSGNANRDRRRRARSAPAPARGRRGARVLRPRRRAHRAAAPLRDRGLALALSPFIEPVRGGDRQHRRRGRRRRFLSPQPVAWRKRRGRGDHAVGGEDLRSDGPAACIAARLVLEPRARLFWLPQETLLFEGARLERRLDADMATGPSSSSPKASSSGAWRWAKAGSTRA